jgi:hypothetical protein
MNRSVRRRRNTAFGLSVLVTSGLVAWAVAQAIAAEASGVALAGIAGVVVFASASASTTRRSRAIAVGLVLVGIAVGLGTGHEPTTTRTAALAIAGAVMFCAAEIADRSLDRPRRAEERPGVDRWSPVLVGGVAAGSAGVSYVAASARSLLGGGGPAGLAAGTAAAVLVAILAAVAVRAQIRTDS